MRFLGRQVAAALLLSSSAAIGLVVWQRDAVLQWLIQSVVPHAPLIQPSVSGFRFDANHVNVSNMQLLLQTAVGSLAVQLHDVQVDYPLKQAPIQSIHAAKARLHFEYISGHADDASSDAPLAMPILPIQHIAVDELDLEAKTSQGVVRFKGRADFKTDDEQAWLLELEERGALIQAKLAPDLEHLQLAAHQSSGVKVWQLELVRKEQKHWQGEFSADMSGFLSWLKCAELIPTDMRPAMARAIGIADTLNIAGIQIDLSAHSADKLQNISGRLLLTRQQTYLASAELAIKPEKGYINFDGHLDLPAAEFFALLKPWLPEAMNSWQFPAGNVMGTVRLNMRPKQRLKGEAYLKAHQLALTAGPARMEDGYLGLELKTFSPLALTVEMDAPEVLLGRDTRISQLQLKAGLKNSTLSLEKATMPMMGGMLEVLPANINIEQRPVRLTLGVRHLDLAKLLESLNYPELSGTGDISGKLPLSLSTESVEVVDGKLHANHAGTLRYQGPQMAGDNPAFQALRSLRYEKLQATLNYRPSGDYQVGLRIEGKNPQVFSGHPIAFNMNLHGHLPDLLQKGIMAGEFEKPILEQVQNGSQN